MAKSSPKKTNKCLEEFNKHRILHLSNMPPSTEGEVREFIGNFKASKVTVSESMNTALVTLSDGTKLDEAVEKLNNKQFKDNVVIAKPGYSEKLLCLAHLPVSYTDDMFRVMCEKYGSVDYAFVMRSDEGVSKGYGFVEYSSDTDQVRLIKTEFDWKQVDGQILHADFVDEACQSSFEGMQSRCLLITNMAETFVDVSKLREMFSCVTSPVYCQIIAKGEKSLGYGIVEFRTVEDAEQTWVKMRDEKIGDSDSVLTFCIPGKSAVMINNRIMWKFGDRLSKNSSLLPDPVAAKPVIAGNPIVISLNKMNPKLMDQFTLVLGELQQAYVSQMMSPVNKPGLLGPAPSLPLSPMMNPNMQLGLLIMMAIYIQQAKKEQFSGVLAKQLNTLSEQEETESKQSTSSPKPSILGDPMTGQANVVLTSLKQQLNQVALQGEDGKDLPEPDDTQGKIDFIVKKFVSNGRYLNLSLLTNLGQLFVTMKQMSSEPLGRASNLGGSSASKGASLLGPLPSNTGSPVSLLGNSPALPALGASKGAALLGDAPGSGQKSLLGNVPSQPAANAVNNNAIMQAMGLNLGSSGSSNPNIGSTLLNQISQGLVHQIGQNWLYQITSKGGSGTGKGLLGDIPKDSQGMGSQQRGGKSSLLGEPPNKTKGSQGTGTSLDQGSWKGMESNRWGTGVSTYDSGYGKGNMGQGNMGQGNMGQGYGDYGYGADSSYSQQDMSGMMGGYGGYGDGSGTDYYNFQQYGYGQDDSYQNYSQYGSTGGMGGTQGSSGMASNYGMGGSGGLGTNQASGVNYQDGQGFNKSSNTGLGQDSSYGTGMGTGMGGQGYGYGGGRGDDLSGNNYDSYGSVGMSGNYGNMGDGMSGNYGSGMSGMGTGMSGMGTGMSGMGTGMSGMGTGMSGMGTGMSGMGTGMSGMGTGMSGMGSGMSGMGSGMSGMGSGMGTGMSGMGSGMSGMGSGMSGVGTGMSGMGSGMGGQMSNMSSGMGSGMSGMGSGMSGMGSGMSGMGNGTMTSNNGMNGMGTMSGMGNNMNGMGSGGMGTMTGSGMGGGMSSSVGMSNMGSSSMRGGSMSGGMGTSGMGGMTGVGSSSSLSSLGGTGGGMNDGMGGMSSYSSGGTMGSGSRGTMGSGSNRMGLLGQGGASSSMGLLGSGSSDMSMMGTGATGSYGSSTSMGAMGSKVARMSGSGDQGMMAGSYYQSTSTAAGGGGGGLLPPPSSKNTMTPVGQKRSHNQLLPEPEPSPDGEYIGQHSQGIGGHYPDSYKRSRLF